VDILAGLMASGNLRRGSCAWMNLPMMNLPTMDTLETEIIEFVARERGKKPEKLQPDARLQDDLGLAGDDAVELFKSFEKRFSTDCSSLWFKWEKHFGPEGGPSPLFVLCAFVVFGIGFGLAAFISPALRWYAGIFLVVVWSWPLKCWPMTRRSLEPITVQMMVDAARAKRWP
jgi:acyl carrier protein